VKPDKLGLTRRPDAPTDIGLGRPSICGGVVAREGHDDMIAIQPAPHGINSSLVKHREELNLELLVCRMFILRRGTTRSPMYRFKIKAQGVLISEQTKASKNSTGEASGG
jgi:hypothetical protein